jgi:hypothetical protein
VKLVSEASSSSIQIALEVGSVYAPGVVINSITPPETAAAVIVPGVEKELPVFVITGLPITYIFGFVGLYLLVKVDGPAATLPEPCIVVPLPPISTRFTSPVPDPTNPAAAILTFPLPAMIVDNEDPPIVTLPTPLCVSVTAVPPKDTLPLPVRDFVDESPPMFTDSPDTAIVLDAPPTVVLPLTTDDVPVSPAIRGPLMI